MGLMQALRGEDWQQANVTLIELDGLETISAMCASSAPK